MCELLPCCLSPPSSPVGHWSRWLINLCWRAITPLSSLSSSLPAPWRRTITFAPVLRNSWMLVRKVLVSVRLSATRVWFDWENAIFKISKQQVGRVPYVQMLTPLESEKQTWRNKRPVKQQPRGIWKITCRSKSFQTDAGRRQQEANPLTVFALAVSFDCQVRFFSHHPLHNPHFSPPHLPFFPSLRLP